MKARFAALAAALIVASLGVGTPIASGPANWLSAPDPIAPGVDFFTSTDTGLVDQAGPIAVCLLRLDPARVRLASVLGRNESVGTDTVLNLAKQHRAIAAINGGLFNGRNGDPIAVLKVAGELVSDAPAIKGAVAIRSPPRGRTELDFDQVSARVSLRFRADGRDWTTQVDGVDTTRVRGKLMLYTSAYHADTDTAPTGTEWVLTGSPLRVLEVRSNMGRTPIPNHGAVLSYGGLSLPDALAALNPGVRVTVTTTWTTVNGLSAKRLDTADHIVNGAGLLRQKGRVLVDWSAESLSQATFINARHPRTLIGLDRRGFIWLAAIDGRRLGHSVGMMFSDLQRLCDRLDLTDALNLDGGGSTTMVVNDRVVNTPSEITGARPVSDAIVVTLR